jgi:ADP-dependent NAD(P)H-hydrate dehydratase / NAD(P)H-hydrate epimerase
MKALTAGEMREVERLITERLAVSSSQLMESAGQSVSAVIQDWRSLGRLSRPLRVAVLCGKGNNGGDGFVAARHLKKDMPSSHIRIYLFSPVRDLRGDAAENSKLWSEGGGATTEVASDADWEKVWQEISWADVIVDALLGTGLRGGASGVVARAVEDLNRFSRNATSPIPALIVAVDTPSGLPSDGEAAQGPVLRAHKTVTFIAPKLGQLVSPNAPCCGELAVRSIGAPPALVDEVGKGNLRWVGPEEFLSLPLIRAVDSHKGTFGHVLVVAGSLGKSGAAVLAGSASLYSGAGLTTISTPDAVLPIVAAAHPEYMTEPLISTETGTVSAANLSSGRFAKILDGKTTLAVGPGLGAHRETQQFILDVVRDAGLPIILDADGLNAFAGKGDLLRSRKSPFLAITPHPGEMARLLGITTAEVQSDRLKAASDAARRWNVAVILKGFHTVIAASDGRLWVNTTGGAGLAKGGSGDVLTGVLAALTAQFGTEDWLRVLALGVYLHGAAADFARGWAGVSGLNASGVAMAVSGARTILVQEIQERA